jgi:hypothetical protein
LTSRALTALDLIICNEGFEPADGVIVSIETVGGFLLSRVGRGEDVAKSKENDPAKIERYPDPPRPPSPLTKIDRWDHVLKLDRSKLGDGGFPYARLISADKGPPTNVAAIIERIVNPIPPISKPRDRYTFYWRDTDVRDDVTRWQFECAEFPHHAEPKLFPLRLIADLEDPRARHGALKVKLSARNLREPFTATFALQQDVTLGDTISRIWTLMPGTSRRLRSSRP